MAENHEKSLIEAFCSIKDVFVMEQFLGEILTENELKNVMLRWKLMRKLMDNVPQREIASDLGISLCKITRGAKILKSANSVSAKIISGKKV